MHKLCSVFHVTQIKTYLKDIPYCDFILLTVDCFASMSLKRDKGKYDEGHKL